MTLAKALKTNTNLTVIYLKFLFNIKYITINKRKEIRQDMIEEIHVGVCKTKF